MRCWYYKAAVQAAFSLALVGWVFISPANAQKRYDPGASDTEIRIGQTMPYSGPVSMLGTVGKASAAYFDRLNAEGGIHGRKIKFISLDDGYSPPKALEQTRRLVEGDEVLLMFSTVGTATNQAVHRYLNSRKVPQLLILTGAAKWNDPKNNPYTLSGMFSYEAEGRAYARHALASQAQPRIAILSQNDDFGRDYVRGLKQALGDKAKSVIVAEATYEVTDATVDSQLVSLKASGANVLMNVSTGKFTVQSLRRAAELGWTPQVYLPAGSTSIASILQPAGLDKTVGAITIATVKNPLDPQWANDAGLNEYFDTMKRFAPALDSRDSLNVTGYSMARILAEVLRRCGDDLTRENVMRQMLSLKDFATPVMLPGVTATTGVDDYDLYGSTRLQRFDGKSWVPFGGAITAR